MKNTALPKKPRHFRVSCLSLIGLLTAATFSLLFTAYPANADHDGNEAPVATNPIPHQFLILYAFQRLELSDYFHGPEDAGAVITYAASSDPDGDVVLSVDGSVLTMQGYYLGPARVTVTATSEGGLSGTQTFAATVVPQPTGQLIAEGLSVTEGDSGTLRVRVPLIILGEAPKWPTVVIPYVDVESTTLSPDEYRMPEPFTILPDDRDLFGNPGAPRDDSFTFEINNDTLIEGLEKIVFRFRTAAPSSLIVNQAVTVLVNDNDYAEIRFLAAEIRDGIVTEEGELFGPMLEMVNGPAQRDVVVRVFVSSSIAQRQPLPHLRIDFATDFANPLDHRLDFTIPAGAGGPGDPIQTLFTPLNDDNQHEPDEVAYIFFGLAQPDERVRVLNALPNLLPHSIKVTFINDDNAPPHTVGTVPKVILYQGGNAEEIDISPYFDDLDGDDLAYAANIALRFEGSSDVSIDNDNRIVSVALSGASMTLTPDGTALNDDALPATLLMTLKARDAEHPVAPAVQRFEIVLEKPPTPRR